MTIETEGEQSRQEMLRSKTFLERDSAISYPFNLVHVKTVSSHAELLQRNDAVERIVLSYDTDIDSEKISLETANATA